MSVPACGPECPAPNWSSAQSEDAYKWCSFPVELPHSHWADIADQCRMNRLGESKTVIALQDIDVWLVEEPQEIKPAIEALYDSMKDPIIGIDTEWKFDNRHTDNDIALISLASSSCVVLIRTCSLDRNGVWGIPEEVKDFCRDDEVVGCGFAWDLSDEKKMQSSFELGRRELFSHFVDVKQLSDMLGYHDISINILAKRVLGFEPPKSTQTTLSNWEAEHLDPRQVRYAAMDALIAADIFRALRFYHNSKPECQRCNTPLGEWPGNLDLHCAAPECARKKPFASISALMGHARSTNHATYASRCSLCYRVTGPTVDDGLAEERLQQREDASGLMPIGEGKKNKKKPLALQDPEDDTEAYSQYGRQSSSQQRGQAEPTLEDFLEEQLSMNDNVGQPSGYQETQVDVSQKQPPKQKHLPSKRSQKRNEHSMYAAYGSFM